MAHHAGPPLARRADAVRTARLRRDPLPRDDRGLRAPHEDGPHGLPQVAAGAGPLDLLEDREVPPPQRLGGARDRKSTRLNSSHGYISYAVFCLEKKKKLQIHNVDS